MVKIPGYMYIVIGLFIGLYSRFVGTTKLTFFWYVGLLFVAVGAIKMVITYFSVPKTKPRQQAHHHRNQAKHPYHQTQGRNMHHPNHLQKPPHPLKNSTYYPGHNPKQAEHHMIHHPISHAKPVQTLRI